MEAIEAIMSRRSVRRYGPEPVAPESLEVLLRAGMQAPSANNGQPWRFVVITDRKLLDAIPEFHRYAQMLREAPAAILVCGDTKLEAEESYLNQACSAATQNILLAAHALGLGAVWLGVHPRPDRTLPLRRLLGIPEAVIPVALISLGHPAEKPAPAERFLPERVFQDGWGKEARWGK
jgi:nitroreductase